MDFGIKGRAAVITGRDSGMGFATAMITFLCSERGSFINGTNIRIDGGSVATV